MPVALPTDQKVGGSSPSERATQTGLVGNPGEACCHKGPGRRGPPNRRHGRRNPPAVSQRKRAATVTCRTDPDLDGSIKEATIQILQAAITGQSHNR